MAPGLAIRSEFVERLLTVVTSLRFQERPVLEFLTYGLAF